MTEAFMLGDREVQPDLGRIRGPDGDVDVEPKTMDVLICLAKHDGKVVSADYLIDEIWHGRPMGDNPIYNCIAKLRKALGDVAGKPRFIATVPKKGYRLLCTPVPVTPSQPSAATANAVTSPPKPDLAMASVAVLPFENLSSDEDHAFLSHGIAAELHGALSRVHRLRVASRRSSYSSDIQNLSVREIANRLNVQYLLCGTVRCTDNRLRLIVELDDAEEDTQLWSKTFDCDIEDVLALAQDIATAIVSEFGGERLRAEISKAARQATTNLDAWSLVQKARCYVLDYSCDALDRALPLLERAADVDPDYGAAHAALGSILAERILNGITRSREEDERIAREAIVNALRLSPNDPFVLKMCASAWAYFGEPARSIDALRRAVKLAPFDFGAWGLMGWPLTETGVSGDVAELHTTLDRILLAAPNHPGVPYWQHHKSVASTCDGDHEKARHYALQSVERNPNFSMAWLQLANTLGYAADEDGARHAAGRGAEINPAMSPQHFADMVIKMSATSDVADRRLGGLRKARLVNGK